MSRGAVGLAILAPRSRLPFRHLASLLGARTPAHGAMRCTRHMVTLLNSLASSGLRPGESSPPVLRASTPG
eukprot:1087055-Pyramimonas_sp.AAC.1